jgi:PST family polysaccharide transporter
MERTLGWLHVPAGRTDRWMRWSLFAAVAQVLALFAGLPFGLTAVATANVACAYILLLPALAYAGQPLGIGVRDVVQAAGRQIVGAVSAAGVGFLLRGTLLSNVSGLERTIAVALAYVLCYFTVVVGFFGMTSPFGVGWSLLRDVAPRRFMAVGGPDAAGRTQAG